MAGLDLSFRLRTSLSANPRINIIEMTDSDIAKIGRWPWPRSWQAAMIEALKNMGAKFIYFDIIFSESSTEPDDLLLENAMKKAGNVYLPFVFQEGAYSLSNAILPIKRLAGHAKGIGAVNIYPDFDGTLRRIPLVFTDKKDIYPHAALKIALDYKGLQIKNLSPNILVISDGKKDIAIPLDEKNNMLINWLGKWQHTFKHHGFLETLAMYQDSLEAKTPAPKKINDFKDSICLVALTAIGLYDIKPIPLQPEYPGIGIFATTVSNILDNNFLRSVPDWINILALYLLSLIAALIILGEKPFRETVYIFLAGTVYFLLSFLLFRNNIHLNLSLPLLGLFTSYLGIETYNFVRVSVEKQSFFKMAVTDGLTGLYNIRYFKILLDTEIRLAQIDPSKKIAIVMSDVDHFKSFNDTYGHQVGDLVLKEVANSLKNAVRSSDIVARYGGEEMIVLLRGAVMQDALNVAEKIRNAIESAVIKDQKNTYKVTISLGVSVLKSGDSVDTVIKRADDGLYKAKQTGRNRVSVMEEDFTHLAKKTKE